VGLLLQPNIDVDARFYEIQMPMLSPQGLVTEEAAHRSSQFKEMSKPLMFTEELAHTHSARL
jgi:hypothetical protein